MLLTISGWGWLSRALCGVVNMYQELECVPCVKVHPYLSPQCAAERDGGGRALVLVSQKRG